MAHQAYDHKAVLISHPVVVRFDTPVVLQVFLVVKETEGDIRIADVYGQ